MTASKTATQLLDFQKTTYTHAFKTIILMQRQTEKVADTSFELVTWYLEESKRHIKQWIDLYYKAFDEHQATADDIIDNMRAVLLRE